MLEAVIIDDDVISVRNLLCLIDSIKYIRCIGSSKTIKDGISLIKTIKPEIVFLNSEFEGSSDFELLHNLDKINVHIIYISNHPDSVGDKNNPKTDFLVKPVRRNKLKVVVKNYLNGKIGTRSTDHLHSPDNPDERKVSIRTCSGTEVFDIKTIVRLEACGNYCMIYLENGRKIISSKTLKYYEELLSRSGFTRINRQDLVHTRFIRKIFKGRYPILELINSERLKVSDRRRKVVRKLLVNS